MGHFVGLCLGLTGLFLGLSCLGLAAAPFPDSFVAPCLDCSAAPFPALSSVSASNLMNFSFKQEVTDYVQYRISDFTFYFWLELYFSVGCPTTSYIWFVFLLYLYLPRCLWLQTYRTVNSNWTSNPRCKLGNASEIQLLSDWHSISSKL